MNTTIGILGTLKIKHKNPNVLSREKLGAFVVGLIEGDGSLQVNHWQKKILQFRLVVKLSDKPLNYAILCKIASIYGGNVRRISKQGVVIWTVNEKKTFSKTILPLFLKYPPLTSRMYLQLKFFTQFFYEPNISLYFATRSFKYRVRPERPFKNVPTYFSSWLGGFIEAEGCFSNRSAGTSSFSIAQNHDLYLIEAIRDFYGANHLKISHKISKVSGFTLFEVSIASLVHVDRVVSHCIPLLQGYKYYQLVQFLNKSKTLKNLHKEFLNSLKICVVLSNHYERIEFKLSVYLLSYL